MALILHEESRCPCGCGNYRDESMSRDWNWDVQHHKCYAGAALDQMRRAYRKEHKDVDSAEDGLIWSVTPVTPTKPR